MVLGVAGTVMKSATYTRRIKNSREIVGVSTVTFGSKNEPTRIPVRASHAPATATTLLITLGGFPADLATIGVVVVGVDISTLFCDWGRRLVTGQFAFQRRNIETL